MDPVDAGYPRLYRAASLTVRPIHDLTAGGEYHDERGLRVGQFKVMLPRNGRWGDHRASQITEIVDGDRTAFMLVVHRGRDYVIADPDGTELGTLRPSAQVLGRRLRVRVTLANHDPGSLRESGHGAKGGGRNYDLSFGAGAPAARIASQFLGTEITEIALVHDPGASPPQRCAALALATCLRQMIVTGYSTGGGGYYG
jgi:hypothetical protein